VAKTVMITLSGDIPETELSKNATVTIEERSYTGIVKVIIIHETEPAPSSVTLQAPGLAVKT
jgi:hypothetical protein